MPNQYPQPEIYKTSHTYTAQAAAGTASQVTVTTNQASNEEVRLYAMSVDIMDSDNSNTPCTSTDWADFDVGITIGSNMVPSKRFDIGWVYRTDSRTIEFTVPILKLYSQQMIVNVQNVTAGPASEGRLIRLMFHGELINQMVDCAPDGGPVSA